jgi:drug/metabolite transporter (DMT)-like permease
MYIILALLSAGLLGIWKFGISLYRGRISPYAVLLLSSASAAATYLLLGLASHSLVLDAEDMNAGFWGGTLNFIATLLILKAVEQGKMGVVTGIAATNALIPLFYSIATGEKITLLAIAGVGIIFIGLAFFFISRSGLSEPGGSSSYAIILAVAAALFYGLDILVLDLGTRVSVTGTLFISQLPQVIVALGVLLASRSFKRMSFKAAFVISGAGVALALANTAFFTAADLGDIGVTSVLAALSPIVTALLALVLLHETMTRTERLALIAVVAGTCLVVG